MSWLLALGGEVSGVELSCSFLGLDSRRVVVVGLGGERERLFRCRGVHSAACPEAKVWPLELEPDSSEAPWLAWPLSQCTTSTASTSQWCTATPSLVAAMAEAMVRKDWITTVQTFWAYLGQKSLNVQVWGRKYFFIYNFVGLNFYLLIFSLTCLCQAPNLAFWIDQEKEISNIFEPL